MSFDPGDAVSRSLKMMDQFYVAMMQSNILKIQAFQYECFSTISEESYLKFCEHLNVLASQALQLREDVFSIKKANASSQTEVPSSSISSSVTSVARKTHTVIVPPKPSPAPTSDKNAIVTSADEEDFYLPRQPNKRDILTCDYCELRFNSLDKMQQHVNIAHSEDFTSKFFPCQSCSLIFLSLDELREHIVCVHEVSDDRKADEDQLCPYCCVVKSNWIEYITHLELEHQILVCKTCHALCNDAQTLQEHVQKSHMSGITKDRIKDIMVPVTEPKPVNKVAVNKRPFDDIGGSKKRGRPKRSAKGTDLPDVLNCHFCTALFNNEDSLRKHIVYKHDTGELQCNDCNLKFKRTSAFENHMRLFHKKVKELKSSYSKQTSENEWTEKSRQQPLLQKLLLKNVRKDESKKQINLVKGQSKPSCEICGEMCSRAEDQEIHKDFHTTRKPDRFLCLFCTELAMPQKELKTHIMSEHRYRCPFCALTFWWKANLEAHLKQLHRTKNCCILCGLQAEGEELRNHIVEVHTAKKAYICKVCYSEHMTLKEMSDHELSHAREGRRPTCDFCARVFGKKKSLKGHILRHIFGSFSCSLCGVQCKTPEELHLHMGEHQKSQFACMCGEYFQTKADLQLHQKKTPCKPFFNQPIHRADLFVEVCIEDTDEEGQSSVAAPATMKIVESHGHFLEDVYQINIAETPAQVSKNFLTTLATVNKTNQMVLPRQPILILNTTEGDEATLIENVGAVPWMDKSEEVVEDNIMPTIDESSV